MQQQTYPTVILSIFLTMGVILIAVTGILVVDQTRFLTQAHHTSGTVTSIDTETKTSRSGIQSVYYPIVEFDTDDGQHVRFVGSTGSNPSSFNEGDAVDIVYNPVQPNDAKINSFTQLWFGPMVSGLIGGLFFLLFGTLLLTFNRKQKRIQWLKAHGQRIQAEIAHITVVSHRSRMIGQHLPYIILAKWLDPATQQVRGYMSETFSFDPTPFIKTKTIDVLIDPNNTKHGWIDTSFLPQA